MMGQNASQLDFSTAVPIAQQQQPQQAQPGQLQQQPQQPDSSLDFSTAVPIAPQPQQPYSDEIRINPDDNIFMKTIKGVGGVLDGMGEGIGDTAATVSDILDKVTGQEPGVVNQYLHKIAGDDNTTHGVPQQIGKGLETIGEFLLGDEILKGLTLSAKFAKTAKIAEMFEKYPKATSIIGNAVRMGTVGATVGGIHGGELGALSGGLGGALVGGAGGARTANADFTTSVTNGMEPWDAANPVEVAVNKQAVSSGIATGEAFPPPEEIDAAKNQVQQEFHQGIRDTAVQAVQDSLQPTPSAPDATATATPTDTQPSAPAAPVAAPEPYEQPLSMRDVMGKAARTVLGSAKDDFQALDDASGGRWQRFNDQLTNVTDKMDEVAGIDDDAYSTLEAKRVALEASQTKMVEDMKAAGVVDPAIADRAQTMYRKGMALQDVNKAVQMATERTVEPGGTGRNNFTVRENVTPAKLAPRLQKLNDVPLDGGASRLQQALGTDGAQRLVDTTDYANSGAQLEPLNLATETGQAALKTLLRNNTQSNPTLLNKSAVQTDWSGVQKDFDALGVPKQRQMFAEDLPKVRKYIQSRTRMQKALPVAGKWILGGATAGGAEYMLTRLLNPFDHGK